MKKILISTFLVLLLISGCGKAPKLENGQEAVVTLKGEDISVDTLYNELKEDYALNILINMVDKQILTEIYPSDADEEDYIDTQLEVINYYYDNYHKTEYDTFLAYIQSQGFEDEEALKEHFSLTYKREQAAKAYAKDEITEKQIKKYYQDEIFGDITVSHILVAPDYAEGASEDVIKAAETKALEKAKSIIKELKSGKDFAELAKKYSDDSSSKVSGGALPAFNKGQQSEEFEKVALELEIGKYSVTPVKDEFGYHIVLKTAQADKPSLEEVKQDIIDQLSNEMMKANKNFQAEALIALREKYKVDIQDKTLKDQYESYVDRITK